MEVCYKIFVPGGSSLEFKINNSIIRPMLGDVVQFSFDFYTLFKVVLDTLEKNVVLLLNKAILINF